MTVSSGGMATFASKPIALPSDALVTVPKAVLSVAAATTTVTVMDKKATSIEQVKIAEHQRF
jgi:hypothetical protein